MESLLINKIEKFTESNEHWIAVNIYDKKESFYFWIDCSLMDGFCDNVIRLDIAFTETYI